MGTSIFIGYTRSFLLGIMPVLLSGLDAILAIVESGETGPITALLVSVLGMDAESAEGAVRLVGVVAGLIIAWERSGRARPYSLNPKDT